MSRAWITAALLALSAPAAAQDVRVERARELFEEGMRALGDERPGEAISPFRRSLALSARVPTAYNLALALRASSELVEAIEVLEGLLADRYGELDDLTRAHAETHRAELVTRIPTLVVRATTELELEVDDRSVGSVSPDAPRELRLDAGEHVVRGVRPDGSSVRREVRLEEGERAALMLSVALPTEPDQRDPPAPPNGGVDPVVVALVTVGAVLVAGGIVTGVVLATAPGYEVDPVWGNTFALTF